jgi:hypothetical protein
LRKSPEINVRSVRENGAHLGRERGEEAFQEAGGGGRVPAGMDFQIDIDRDDFGLDQSKIMTAISINGLERDFSGKPRTLFRIPL